MSFVAFMATIMASRGGILNLSRSSDIREEAADRTEMNKSEYNAFRFFIDGNETRAQPKREIRYGETAERIISGSGSIYQRTLDS